jgi:VanZ family protein
LRPPDSLTTGGPAPTEARTVMVGFVPPRILQAVAWFCVVLIAYLSLVPEELEVRTGISGKLEHVAAYLGTSALLALSYPRKPWLIVLGLAAYGGLLEVLQSLSPGRTPSILDASASWSGAILGVVAVGFLGRRLEPRLRRPPAAGQP